MEEKLLEHFANAIALRVVEKLKEGSKEQHQKVVDRYLLTLSLRHPF